jgi:chromosome segregation ATPase
MTETKEDQQQITDMINRDLRGAIKHLKDTGCDGVTIATLENCFSHFKSQLSNREEEIEELNTAFKCEKAFKEGSEKANSKLNEKCNEYVKFYQQERKNVIDLENQIQEFKSQLSNRDKEIEELKGELEYHKEIVASHERAQKERHKVVELCFPPKSKGEAQ